MKEKMEQLAREIEQHNYNYYVLDDPKISDFEYDAMLNELIALEKQYPQYKKSKFPHGKSRGRSFLRGLRLLNIRFRWLALQRLFLLRSLKALTKR